MAPDAALTMTPSRNMEQHHLVVISTYGEKLGHVNGKGKGLYVLKFDRSSLAFTEDFGKAQLGDVFKNPSYVTVYRDSVADRLDVYVVEESHSDAGFVAALTLNESTGELACNGEPNRRDLADAAACCHVSVAPGGSHVLAANYLTGSVVAIARLPDGKLDGTNVQYVDLPPATHPITYPLPNAARQERAHAHMVRVSAGTKSSTVLVPDLGSDVVWSIPFDAASLSSPLGEPVPSGSHPALAGGGPRHLALHPTEAVCYVCYELTSLVAAFKIDRKSGAISDEPPVGLLCALDGVGSHFLHGELPGAGARLPSGCTVDASKEFTRFVAPNWALEGTDASGLKPGHGRRVCSDKVTSLAAIGVAPDGSHLVVSSRIVGAPGALSAIPLTPSGLFVDAHDRPIRVTRTLGETPRDFAMLPALPSASPTKRQRRGNDNGGGAATSAEPQAGMLALVANQDDDKIVVLCEGGPPTELTTKVPTPVCVCIVPSRKA